MNESVQKLSELLQAYQGAQPVAEGAVAAGCTTRGRLVCQVPDTGAQLGESANELGEVATVYVLAEQTAKGFDMSASSTCTVGAGASTRSGFFARRWQKCVRLAGLLCKLRQLQGGKCLIATEQGFSQRICKRRQ